MIGGCLVCARLVLYLLAVDWWLFGIYLRFACLCGRTTLRAGWFGLSGLVVCAFRFYLLCDCCCLVVVSAICVSWDGV